MEATFASQVLCSQMDIAKVSMFLCLNENSPKKQHCMIYSSAKAISEPNAD